MIDLSNDLIDAGLIIRAHFGICRLRGYMGWGWIKVSMFVCGSYNIAQHYTEHTSVNLLVPISSRRSVSVK